ncbi:TPA: MarR family transcriptional regulator, partial [Enterococcus faecium]
NEALESFSPDQISTIKQILEKVSYTINEYQVSLTRKED